MNLKERTYLWYIAVLRIYVGYYMLQQGVRKFLRDFSKGDWIGRPIGDLATLDIYSWYKKFLLDYVVPHHELFGYLVGEGLEGGEGAEVTLTFPFAQKNPKGSEKGSEDEQKRIADRV